MANWTVRLNVFEPKTISLAGLPGVNNNPAFAFQLVAEFESTAAGTTNENYVGTMGSYNALAGIARFEMVTISGTPSGAPQRPVLGSPSWLPNQWLQFTLTDTPGSNYAIQARTNLTVGDWLPLLTNPSPFIFVDTNASNYPQRFYRAVLLP